LTRLLLGHGAIYWPLGHRTRYAYRPLCLRLFLTRLVDLAAVALGNMFCNVTGLSMGMGMATAMDTLISQAYGHSPKSPLVGIIFQRGMLILMLMCVPIAAVWLSAEPILIAFQQDPEVAQLAGLYARLFLPGLPFIFLFECWRKYLQGQGIMYVSTLATLVGLIVNIMCCYLFIFVFGLGFAGAPIAMSVTGFSMPTFTWYVLTRLREGGGRSF